MAGLTLSAVERAAREELRDRWVNYRDELEREPGDVIHEIADACVPVYTSQLLELACDDNALATDEPELGPAFDGTPTPVNVIEANIYERLTAALWQEWRGIDGDHD